MQDLLGVLGVGLVSGISGHYAAKSPTLRWNVGNTDSIFTDVRFIGGAVGLGLNMVAEKGTAADLGAILSAGMVGSLATSEAFRRQAIANAQAMAQGQPPGQPGAFPAPAQGAFGPPQQYIPAPQSPLYEYVRP